MNILVIGNGFDLAHGLPTMYQDFLEFTDDYDSFLRNQFRNQITEVESLVDNNTWLSFFKKLYEENGWIGFERQISNIVQVLDNKVLEFDEIRKRGRGSVRFIPIEQEVLKDFNSDVIQGRSYDAYFVFKTRNCMLDDLLRLIRCLEIYLSCYINHFLVKKISPDIEKLNIDRVLSFNYTDTYVRIYDNHKKSSIEYDYIHGKADINNTIETNNMVLGIDEYLSEDRKDKDIEFITFKKYYQRIYKGTGCKYKDWINAIRKENEIYMARKHDFEISLKNGYVFSNEIERIRAELKQLNENPPRHNLYIFGHSLDVTDKDILRDLILNDNVYTSIYYPDKKELGRKIANLVKVIGQDELIRRTGGSTRTIEFKLQQPMVPISQ